MHGRHRLGHRALLHRLRPARQRRHRRHVRGHAGLPRQGPLLADHREVQRHRSSTPRRPPSAPSCGGATSTPQKHDLSSLRLLGTSASRSTPRPGSGTRAHRRRPLPGRRHLVADRDGHDHDLAAARLTTTKPGSATLPFPGIDADVVDERRQRRAARQRRLPRARRSPGRRCCAASTAIPSATRQRTGADYPGMLLHRRRLQARRGRLLLAAGPGRRRHERLRPPHRHHGGRERRWSTTRRSPRRRSSGSTRRRSTGRRSSAFVILKPGIEPTDELGQELKQHVAEEDRRRSRGRSRSCSRRTCPKTRSGKIMRRLLRDIAEEPRPGRHDHAGRYQRGEHHPRPVRRRRGLTATARPRSPRRSDRTSAPRARRPPGRHRPILPGTSGSRLRLPARRWSADTELMRRPLRRMP